MGWVSNFLSKAVLAGFILGCAIGALGPGRVFGTVREAVNAVTGTSAETTS